MRSLYPWPLFPPDANSRATRSLSLQLCLQEWMSTFICIDALEKKTADPHTLAESIQSLLLFSLDSPFSVKPGALDKLCCYLHKLLGSSTLTSKSPNISEIEMVLDRMQEQILSFRSKINGWKYAPSSTALIAENVHSFCTQLRQALLSFFNALFPFFEEAKSDENVLFYLIEHKTDINATLQKVLPFAEDGKPIFATIEHLLGRLYPSGPAHLRTILCEGYTRRGFGEFYAQHKTLIESIEWLADQCSTPMSTCN